MTEAKHNPVPWTYEEAAPDDAYGEPGAIPFNIRCAADWVVAATIGDVPDLPAEDNAAFICRAVNAHDDLVAALRNLTDRFPGVLFAGLDDVDVADADAVKAAQIALAKATLA